MQQTFLDKPVMLVVQFYSFLEEIQFVLVLLLLQVVFLLTNVDTAFTTIAFESKLVK